MIPEFKGFSNLTALPAGRQASGMYGLSVCDMNVIRKYFSPRGNAIYLCHVSKETDGRTGQGFLFNEVKI